MQKNILLSVLFIFASIFFIAFAMTTYRYYQAIHSDDPISPYLLIEKWTATITRGNILIDMITLDFYEVQEWDIIITRADSLSVINWPDRSTTRLGANSRLTIERMRVADDYSRIELVASLESGKSWSNIVRILYPDSRVEFHLPRNGTVAGVRGTVFEINLDANYIHSIDHSVTLSNSIGQLVTLLPGDAVAANNILTKIGTKLDTTWITANTIADAAFMQIRNIKLRDTYTLLSSSSGGIFDFWDRFIRWVLSFFSGFDSITTISTISSGNLANIANISQTSMMRWYQSFQSTDFVQERDQFRWAIISLQDQLTGGDQVIESLTRGAMWDMLASSGVTLQNTKWLLDAYSRKKGTTLDTIMSGARSIDTSTITEGGRAIYERLMR